LEPVAVRKYEVLTSRKTKRVGTRLHKKYPWARASTDRIIPAFGVNGSDFGRQPVGDLEIKTRGEGPFNRVLRKGPFQGDSLQLQWSMWCWQHTWGSLGILGVFGDLPMLQFDQKADADLQDVFAEQGAHFAETVFVNRRLPEPTFGPEDRRCKTCEYRVTCRGEAVDPADLDVRERMEKSKKQLVQITDAELAVTLQDIKYMEAEVESLEESIDVAKDKVLARLDGTDGAVVTGFGTVYRMAAEVNRFDTTRFKQDDPATYAKYFISRPTGHYYIKTYPTKEK
jgi:hypothetical protein